MYSEILCSDFHMLFIQSLKILTIYLELVLSQSSLLQKTTMRQEPPKL